MSTLLFELFRNFQPSLLSYKLEAITYQICRFSHSMQTLVALIHVVSDDIPVISLSTIARFTPNAISVVAKTCFSQICLCRLNEQKLSIAQDRCIESFYNPI